MKKLLLTLLFCLFSFSANAKVTVFDFPLNTSHVDVIKDSVDNVVEITKSGKDSKVVYV